MILGLPTTFCPSCRREFGPLEQSTRICVRCGLHRDGIRCTAGHLHGRISEVDACDDLRRTA